MKDNIVKINLNDIDTFKEHPFLVNNDESFMDLVKSIKENGLLHPLIVRKKENDRYEMIFGHRRKKALEMLGVNEVEVIVKDLNDDEATIFMVDSNLYRERILPSEKAFAYKMKMDALKHQGKKTCATGLHKTRDAICPFFQFSDSIRKIMYTTNTIESLNRQFRKFTKTKSVFPTDMSSLKCLYLSTRNISKKWDQAYRNWGPILSELSIMFDGRI